MLLHDVGIGTLQISFCFASYSWLVSTNRRRLVNLRKEWICSFQFSSCSCFAFCLYRHHLGNDSSSWRWQSVPITAQQQLNPFCNFSIPLEPVLFCSLQISIPVGQCSLLRNLELSSMGTLFDFRDASNSIAAPHSS